jgi:hypothetical protein
MMSEKVEVSTVAASAAARTDDGYADLEALVRDRLKGLAGKTLFTTDAAGLYDAYLAKLPAETRKHYDCRACRAFVDGYGGLVTVESNGTTTPAVFGDALLEACPPFFGDAVEAVRDAVVKARVTGVFASADTVLGRDGAGTDLRGNVWTHLSGPNPTPFPPNPLLTADGFRAGKLEDFSVLRRSVDEFPSGVAVEAVRLIRAGELERPDKALDRVEWFMGVQASLAGLKDVRRRNNVLWYHVASAPAGFARVRTSAVGTLLADVAAGKGLAAIKRAWAEKLDPLRYQRPTAAPKAGNVDRAEKVFAALGAESALRRRYATLADVLKWEWRPSPAATAKPAGGGIFDHLRNVPKTAADKIVLPPRTMTWVKFAAEVLPRAKGLEILAPANGPYYGLTTAVDPDARPILQWDGLAGEARNPAAWFFYHGGSSAHYWGLEYGRWYPVAGVFLSPPHWQRPDAFRHQPTNAFFAVADAKDRRKPGLALFPELLKAELREVRAVVEAHSGAGNLEGADAGDANGLAFQKEANNFGRFRLRVTDAHGGVEHVDLDRWD